MNDEYLTMTEIGKKYGATSHKVGKMLRELGYRTEKNRPSAKAFDAGLVAQQWDKERPLIYMWAWHEEKTSALLEANGLTKVADGAA